MNFRDYPLHQHPLQLDARDIMVCAGEPVDLATLPDEFVFDFSKLPTFDQGPEGTCVGHALKLIMIFHLLTKGIKRSPSQRDIYEYAHGDSPTEGCDPRVAIDGLLKRGACNETTWPYTPKRRGTPGPTADAERGLTKLLAYANAGTTAETLLPALYQGGSPLAMQIPVYDGFYDAKPDGTVDNAAVGTLHGYHEVTILGYSKARKALLLQNSWGESYGQGGKVWYPLSSPIVGAFTMKPDVKADLPPHVKTFWEQLFPWLFHG